MPLKGWPPFHPPDAMQEAAFALDQFSVEDCPAVIEGGLALSVIVGASATPVTLKVPCNVLLDASRLSYAVADQLIVRAVENERAKVTLAWLPLTD